MSNIILGQKSVPHWAQRVGDFLGNMGAEQRQQRQLDEQQKQQAMQQEIERYRKFVASAPPEQKQHALQQVPEEFRGYVSIEATEFQKSPMQLAQEQAAIAEAQQKAAAAGAKTSDITGGSPILRNAGVGYSDKVIEMAGDEAFLATLPPEVAQKIKFVAAKVAPDANTVLNSDTTRRGQDTQVQVANINQAGADGRHDRPDANTIVVDKRLRELGKAPGNMDQVTTRRVGLVNSAGKVLEQIGNVTGDLVRNSRSGTIDGTVQANRDRKKLEGLINAATTLVAKAAGEDRVAKEDAQRFRSLISPGTPWTLMDSDMADQMLMQARELLYGMRSQMANGGGSPAPQNQPRPSASPSPAPAPGRIRYDDEGNRIQ
jgi:hypothetical protein